MNAGSDWRSSTAILAAANEWLVLVVERREIPHGGGAGFIHPSCAGVAACGSGCVPSRRVLWSDFGELGSFSTARLSFSPKVSSALTKDSGAAVRLVAAIP